MTANDPNGLAREAGGEADPQGRAEALLHVGVERTDDPVELTLVDRCHRQLTAQERSRSPSTRIRACGSGCSVLCALMMSLVRECAVLQ